MRVTRFGRVLRQTAVALAAAGSVLVGSTIAEAANYANMTCSQLWYARNAIYAQNGYCFKSVGARKVFGPGCFPPFGKLSGYEAQQVANIQYWERQKGC